MGSKYATNREYTTKSAIFTAQHLMPLKTGFHPALGKEPGLNPHDQPLPTG
jgi:hypothetical protein